MNDKIINWFDLCSLEDIPMQGSRRLITPECTIAIFRTHTDKVFAIEDKCPHLGGTLSEGIVHGSQVTCPLHNLVINLCDGKAAPPDTGCVRTFPIKLDKARIQIDLTSINQKAA